MSQLFFFITLCLCIIPSVYPTRSKLGKTANCETLNDNSTNWTYNSIIEKQHSQIAVHLFNANEAQHE